MKNKLLLIFGAIIISLSSWSLYEYQNMEDRMKGFKAYDNPSWILLFIGVAMVTYFIFANFKSKKT